MALVSYSHRTPAAPAADSNETRLVGREWVVTDLSLADFALASTFVFRKPAGMSLEGLPGVAAWIERVEALDSWQRAVAPMLRT